MKKILSVILAVLLLGTLFSMQAVAQEERVGTDYFVDSKEGDDNNSGTSASSAWKSIKKVNDFGEFKPGDRILFKRDCTFKGILCPKGSGSAENPITLGAYGDESGLLPYIKAEYMPTGMFDRDDEIVSNPAEVDTAIYFYNQSNWIVENLEVTNNISGTGAQYCIYVSAGDWYTVENFTIKDCDIHGTGVDWKSMAHSGLTGILVTTRSYSGIHDGITITGNTVKNCKDDGIVVFGSTRGCEPDGTVNANSTRNVYIAENYLYNIGGDGILVNNCNTPIVEYNIAERCHSFQGSQYCVAIWAFACKDALFQYNESFDTQPGGDSQGFDCDYQCVGTTFQYNYSHDNAGGFMLICTEPTEWGGGVAFNVGSVVRYNISQNDRGIIFALMGHIENTWIYNNTVFTTWTSTGHLICGGSKNNVFSNNTHIINNLFYADSGQNAWQTMRNTTLANNLIYGQAAQWFPHNGEHKLAEGEEYVLHAENNIRDISPKINKPGEAGIGFESCEAYLLRVDSPAINAGIPVANPSAHPCKTDFFGNSIEGDEKPNIGADNTGTLPRANDFILNGGQYKTLTDWEHVAVGVMDANIPLLNGNCTTWSSTAQMIDNDPNGENYSGKKGSQKTIRVTGKYSSGHAIAFTLPAGTFQNATGMRFWAAGGDADRVAKLTFTCSDGVTGYNYSVWGAVPKDGGWVYIDFYESDFVEEWNGRPDGVVRDYLKNTSFLRIEIGCDLNQSFYIDDVEVCVGGIKTDYAINDDGFLDGVAPDTAYTDFVAKIKGTNGGSFTLVKGDEIITDGNVGTGMTLKVIAGDGGADYLIVIPGDVSGDGSVSSLDLLTLKKAVMGLDEIEVAQKFAGDLTKDEKLSSFDCLKLKRVILGE